MAYARIKNGKIVGGVMRGVLAVWALLQAWDRSNGLVWKVTYASMSKDPMARAILSRRTVDRGLSAVRPGARLFARAGIAGGVTGAGSALAIKHGTPQPENNNPARLGPWPDAGRIAKDNVICVCGVNKHILWSE